MAKIKIIMSLSDYVLHGKNEGGGRPTAISVGLFNEAKYLNFYKPGCHTLVKIVELLNWFLLT